MILSALILHLLVQAVAVLSSSPESGTDSAFFDPKFHENAPDMEPIAEESRVEMSVSEVAEPGMPEDSVAVESSNTEFIDSDSVAIESSNAEFIDSDSLAVESEHPHPHPESGRVKITPIQGVSYSTIEEPAVKNSYIATVRFPEGKVVGNSLKSEQVVGTDNTISEPEGWVPNSDPEYASGETSSPAPISRPKVTWPGPVQNQITPQKYHYSVPIDVGLHNGQQEQYFYSKENPAGYNFNVGAPGLNLNRGKLVHSLNSLGTFIREIPKGLGLGLSSVYRMIPPSPVKQAGPSYSPAAAASASHGYATSVSHGSHASSSAFYEGKGWGPSETGGPAPVTTIVNQGWNQGSQGYGQSPVAVKHHSSTGSAYGYNRPSVGPLPPPPSQSYGQGWSESQGEGYNNAGHVTNVVTENQGWTSGNGQDQGSGSPVTIKHHSTSGSYVHSPSPGYSPGPPPTEAYGSGGSTTATPSVAYGIGTGGGSYPPIGGDGDNGVAPPAPTHLHEVKGHGQGHRPPPPSQSFEYTVSNPVPELHKIPISIPKPVAVPFPRIKIPKFHLVKRPVVINLAIPRVRIPAFRIPSLPKFPRVQVSKGQLSGNPTAFMNAQGISGLSSFGNDYESSWGHGGSSGPEVHTSTYKYTTSTSSGPSGQYNKGSLSSLYNVPSSSFEDVLSGGHQSSSGYRHGQVSSISDITNGYQDESGDDGKPLKSYYATPEEYEAILRDLDGNTEGHHHQPHYTAPKDLRIPTTAGYFRSHSGKWIRVPYRIPAMDVRGRSKGSGYRTIHHIPSAERDPIFQDLPGDHESSYELKNPACENKNCDEYDKEKTIDGLKEALEDLLRDNVEIKRKKKGGRLRNIILRNAAKQQRMRNRRKCLRRGRKGRKRCLFF